MFMLSFIFESVWSYKVKRESSNVFFIVIYNVYIYCGWESKGPGWLNELGRWI